VGLFSKKPAKPAGPRAPNLALADLADQDDPLNVVAGESHYFATLYQMTGPPTEDDIGYRVPWWFFVQRQADNQHDANAIAVYALNGEPDEHDVFGQVGFIQKDLASILAPALDAFGANPAITVPGILIGGYSAEKPNIGVYLYLQQDELTEGLGVDPALLAGFGVPIDLD
jgi:hypothetical protein